MAITTIVLSFGGVVASVFGLLSSLLLSAFLASDASDQLISPAGMIGLALGSLCYGSLLCAGAVLLLKRRQLGITFVIAGAAVAIVLSLATLALVPGVSGGIAIRSVVGLIFPVATLIFALLPGTREWCAGPKPQPQQWGPGQSF